MAVLQVENVAISICFHLVSSDHFQKEHWLFMTGGVKAVVYGFITAEGQFFFVKQVDLKDGLMS